MADPRKKIVESPFVDLIRLELRIDRAEYEELKQALIDLAREWKGRDQVEKRVMQELYVLAPIVQNTASGIRNERPQLAEELEECAVELDALVLECLAG